MSGRSRPPSLANLAAWAGAIDVIGKAVRVHKDTTAARGANVLLFPHVKMRENWFNDPERHCAIRLDFPKV